MNEKVVADLTPQLLSKLSARYGDSVVFNRTGRMHFLFTEAASVNEILVSRSSSFLKGEQEQALAASVGWGLLTHEGDTHKKMQTILRPAVRGEILNRYVHSVSELAKDSIERMGSRPSSLVQSAREFSQDSAESTLFGLPQPTRDYRYHEAVWGMNSFIQQAITAVDSPEAYRAKTSAFLAHKNTIDEHVATLIQLWQANGRPGGNFLEYLFGSGDALADSVNPIGQESSLFLQAATETTASLIAWVAVALDEQPQYWEMLRHECRAVSLDSYQSVKDLELLNAVVQETLRLFPPVWLIPRVAVTDVEISGVKIPRGARVIVSPWVTQRSEKNFSDADVFVPERWLEPRFSSERGDFFPFGLGSRICIGESFGKMTASVFLYELCRTERDVTLDARDSTPKNTSLISYPDEAIKVQLLG